MMAEVDRQELAAKMTGLLRTDKGAGTQVNVMQQQKVQLNAPNPLTTTPDFRRATDRLLYPNKYLEREGPIDVQVVKE
jgi:hypothetical protein